MKQLHSLFVTAMLCTLLFSACKHDFCGFSETDPIPNPGPISFENLAIGQTSKYLGLWGEDYYNDNNDIFGYTDDTLELKIVGQDAQGFKVRESFHYVGDVVDWLKPDKDSVYYYYLEIVNDTLRIHPGQANNFLSRIFAYHTSKSGLPVANITSPKIEITGWKTAMTYCECRRTGFAENYSLFGQNYPLLNVVVENSPMSFDGNGETYVYSKSDGIIRFSTYSWWTQSGIGWDLLP